MGTGRRQSRSGPARSLYGGLMFIDGYGDLSETEQILADEEQFFATQGRKHLGRDPDDTAQEARIAAWQSLAKNPGNRAYMNIAAIQRVNAHVYRDQWFGVSQGVAGKPLDPIRRRHRDSIDDPDLSLVLESEQDLEAMLLAYHDGEIVAAINRLAPDHREYVVLRFWGGYTNPEIAAIQNKSNGYVKSAWVKVVRPRLLAELEHLR